MLPYQQRVVDEKSENDTKAKALSAFIAENPLFEKVDQDEQGRMRLQLDLMHQLSKVLGDRIAAFQL